MPNLELRRWTAWIALVGVLFSVIGPRLHHHDAHGSTGCACESHAHEQGIDDDPEEPNRPDDDSCDETCGICVTLMHVPLAPAPFVFVPAHHRTEKLGLPVVAAPSRPRTWRAPARAPPA